MSLSDLKQSIRHRPAPKRKRDFSIFKAFGKAKIWTLSKNYQILADNEPNQIAGKIVFRENEHLQISRNSPSSKKVHILSKCYFAEVEIISRVQFPEFRRFPEIYQKVKNCTKKSFRKKLKNREQRGPSVSEINWDKQKSVFKEL